MLNVYKIVLVYVSIKHNSTQMLFTSHTLTTCSNS